MRVFREILPYGPDALLLNWEQRIDPVINASVHAYAATIRSVAAVKECVPAYASLLVCFDPKGISAYALRETLFELRPAEASVVGIEHTLPVCYDVSLAPDLPFVCEALGLTAAEVIELHVSPTYRVYQIGYQPGFGFLGPTHEGLNVPRRAEPRLAVPVGAVGLAGRQTGIYPSASPGGWQLIGRCPWPMLGSGDRLARLHAGDSVRFRAISPEEYHRERSTTPPWPKR